MVTWLGYIGKLVELMATTLIGKRITLALDPKRRAGQTFIRLHYILGALTEVTEELTTNLDKPLVDGIGREAWLFNVDEEITRLSNEFLHLTDKLHQTLEIFDPNLSLALSDLVYYKFSVLLLASHSFKRPGEEKNPSAMIEYEYPNQKLLTIDFEEHYRWIAAHPEYFKRSGSDEWQLEWPQSVLLNEFGRHELTETGVIRRGSIEEQAEDIEKLRRLLKTHTQIIKQANERLREFIASNFAIGDVLY
jgi:hypothetical protein